CDIAVVYDKARLRQSAAQQHGQLLRKLTRCAVHLIDRHAVCLDGPSARAEHLYSVADYSLCKQQLSHTARRLLVRDALVFLLSAGAVQQMRKRAVFLGEYRDGAVSLVTSPGKHQIDSADK